MAMNPAKYTKAQEDAKKYMESHNLERLVAIMLNHCIQRKSGNPKVFMIKFLMERCSAQELTEAGVIGKGSTMLKFLEDEEKEAKRSTADATTQIAWPDDPTPTHKKTINNCIELSFSNPQSEFGLLVMFSRKVDF